MENKRSIISTYASSLPSYYNLIEFKDTIYKENFKKTGVYRWTNLKNDKIYRGSSSNLGKRFSGYFSIKFLNKESLKTKSLICSALLKYGYGDFKLDILEYCDPKELLDREQYYLNKLFERYSNFTLNLSKVAGSTKAINIV